MKGNQNQKKKSKLVKEDQSRSRRGHSENLEKAAAECASKQTLDYIRHAVAPKTTNPAPRPSSSVVYNGRVELIKMRAVGTAVVGTGGFGVVVVDPASCAGCSDRLLGWMSGSAYAGTNASTVPLAVPSGCVGLEAVGTTVTGAGLTGNVGDLYAAAVNACAIYIKPKGSATTQDGTMYLLEFPNHPDGVSTTTVQQQMSHQSTRVISGSQIGTPGFNNVLNWHPQPNYTATSASTAESDSIYFAPASALTGSLIRTPLVIHFTGTVGSTYEVEIHGSWMARGLRTQATVPNFCDSKGMEGYYNSLLFKQLSGWEGSPEHALATYHAGLVKADFELRPRAEKERLKAKAVIDSDKSMKSWSSAAVDALKFLKPMAKELGGFIL
jgi:hypothetical protein